MPLKDLDSEELDVVRDCLRAAAEGPFFPDWEFATLFGLERAEVKSILHSWPDLNENDEAVVLAINNSFNNLLGYPHGLVENWSDFIRVNSQEVARIYTKWRGGNVRNYFEASCELPTQATLRCAPAYGVWKEFWSDPLPALVPQRVQLASGPCRAVFSRASRR